MKAVQELREEHRRVELMLEQAVASLEPFDKAGLAAPLSFFEAVYEGQHERKEEEVLFPALAARLGEMAAGPIRVMEKEHRLARAFVRAARHSLEAAGRGEPGAVARVISSVRSHSDLVRSHIRREETVLFVLAERALLDEDKEILARFRVVLGSPRPIDLPEEPEEIDTVDLHPAKKHEATQVVRLRKEPRHGPATMLDARALAADEPTASEDTALAAKVGNVLFENNGHRVVLLHDFGRGLSVQANQYLIVHDGAGLILDPGGPKVYPDVYAETMLRLGDGQLRYIFLSHQDPDIGTSLNAWLMDTKADAYVSRLWVRFLPHYGIDRLLEKRLRGIPDDGLILDLNGAPIEILPAHFLHSPGNCQIYDPTSKVLFTGDLGAGIGVEYGVVPDFEAHVPYMLGFHQRYMAGNAALRAWVAMARQLDVEIIAPQHGAMFKGRAMVNKFLDWCEELQCGLDLVKQPYRRPTRTA
jgi:hemerythrin-like domain-containing protein/glyoxylase-like metal-dependent hydrolase (beta-lactamase superfamily II)